MALLKQSTARNVAFLMVDSTDHITGKTGLTVTVTLSKDAAAFGAAGGSVTEISSGWYKIALNTTDTNTLGCLAIHATATGADATDQLHEVVADLPGATVSSVTGAVGSVTGAVGSVTAAVTVGTISNNVITAASINADAITAAKIADGAIDAATFAAGAINAAAIAADAITDAKVAADVTIASVTGAVGSVTGAVGSVTGNVGGNVTGSVGSIATGGIASTSFAAGAIDAAALAADAIGSSELAATAVAEIADGVWDEARSGHTTQGTYGENHSVIESAAAATGTLSTTQATTDLSNATDDAYNGRTIIFLGNVTAALKNQATNVTDYVGATKLLTFTAVTSAPANGDKFVVV